MGSNELKRPLATRLLALALSLAGLVLGAGALSANTGFLGGPGGVSPLDPRATPQWRGALGRQAEVGRETCSIVIEATCVRAAWDDVLTRLSGKARPAQLAAINSFVNQVRYRDDRETWGASDYWATPREFFARGGDCEDYAIAKYFALRELGVAASDMLLAVVTDKTERTRHAVLVVAGPSGPVTLDNRTDRIIPWRSLTRYRSIYWVNEEGGWITSARR